MTFPRPLRMPRDCRVATIRRNTERMFQVLPVLGAFGLLMTLTILMTRTPDDPRYWLSLGYYGTWIVLGGLPLAALGVVRARNWAPGVEEIVCLLTITLIQGYCLYQRTISHFEWEGYVVWTIANLVLLALFQIRPGFFLASMALQFAGVWVYEQSLGHGQVLNLGVLTVVTLLLNLTHWNLTIRDFERVKALEAANEKSDELLRNILPPKVIQDLKVKGEATPEYFEQVSILFTDLVNFTEIAGRLEPQALITELSDLFGGFDAIVEAHGCTRIKTIGDSYMAVCGLPDPDPRHAQKIVAAGLECLEFLRRRNETSATQWTMRVGIHTGPVVAGIVGVKRYIYDIFGDSVNIASRMESSSHDMRVNVSEETYRRTKDDFAYEPRDPQPVKGKGLMNMYFALDNPRPSGV